MASKKYPESRIQIAAVSVIRNFYPDILFFHPPNGGERGSIEGGIFKDMGMLAGVSDLIFLEPTDEYHGLIIEIKANEKERLSPSQSDFFSKAAERGYKCVVATSTKQIVYELELYMGLTHQVSDLI